MPVRVEPIQAHAAENLQFIRDAMARASDFTAVPGWGGVLNEVTALRGAGGVGTLVDGRRLRRSAHHVRIGDCEEIWGLKPLRGSWKSEIRSQKFEVRSPNSTSAARSSSTGSFTNGCASASSARSR